jgi:hypothetical protein
MSHYARWCRAPLSLAAALLAFATCAYSAPKLAQCFPDLVSRKPNLGSIALLCETYGWLDLPGDHDRMLVDQTMALGPEVARRVKEALVEKGYRVESGGFVTAGMLQGGRMIGKSKADSTVIPSADSSGVFMLPFYRDTTILRSQAMSAAFQTLLARLIGYERKPGKSPAYFTEPILLGDSLGAPVIAIVNLTYYGMTQREAMNHKLRFNPFKKLAQKAFGDETVDGQNTFCVMSLSLADGKTGEVLWHDQQIGYDFSVPGVEKLTAKIQASLP